MLRWIVDLHRRNQLLARLLQRIRRRYPNGGVKVGIPIPDQLFTLTLEGYTGHQWVEDNGRFGADDYQDWKLGLSVGIKMLTLSAYYTDTNLGKSDCGGTGNCGPRAVWRSAPPSDNLANEAALSPLPPSFRPLAPAACGCYLRRLPRPVAPSALRAARNPQQPTSFRVPGPLDRQSHAYLARLRVADDQLDGLAEELGHPALGRATE